MCFFNYAPLLLSVVHIHVQSNVNLGCLIQLFLALCLVYDTDSLKADFFP